MPVQTQDVDEIVGYANGDGTFSVELHSWGITEGEKIPMVMKIPKAEIDVKVFATNNEELWSIEYAAHK